ncbi:MAG: helix-turn-helix transcriptional regulator [Kiritimatiellae bacterium]|nr:helix-turn-helix transcriptional regulator [Kiritimatiellia bacterium]
MLKGKTIIAERLRQLRGTSSLREMADAVGIKYSAWARYEAGGSLPGADILARICCVHACSADWILGLSEHSGSITAGTGAAVAIGANARASVRGTSSKAGEMPACSKCPYKKRWEKIAAMK